MKDLSAQGLLTWGPDGPQLQVPREIAHVVRQDLKTIDAVLRRATAFAKQLEIPSTDLFVRLRDPKWTVDGCPSCGSPVREHDLRCELCALAAELALKRTP